VGRDVKRFKPGFLFYLLLIHLYSASALAQPPVLTAGTARGLKTIKKPKTERLEIPEYETSDSLPGDVLPAVPVPALPLGTKTSARP